MSYIQENAKRVLPLWWLAAIALVLIGAMLVMVVRPALANSHNPSISLEQCRNGRATNPNDCLSLGGGTGWVNGNAGASNAHFVEGHSIPYRAIMTGMPVGETVTLTLAYDIKHSGRHALDFVTHYDRLQPHGQFDHLAETVDPTSGVPAVEGLTPTTVAILAPSSTQPCASPVADQPTTRFNSLPAAQTEMTLWGGDLTGFAYVTQGCLTAAKAETSFSVTFVVEESTMVLAWGGHIARSVDWNGMAAPQISGSPYHMRVKGWTLGNLGSQDRSLSAAAVISETSGTTTLLQETNEAGTTVIQSQTDAAPSTSMTVIAGAYVRDTATVTPPNATGSVAFKYYFGATQAAAITACSADTDGTGGTGAGGGNTPETDPNTVQSNVVQFNDLGFYAWRAFFTGTGIFEDSASDCSDEILIVAQAPTALNTTPLVFPNDSARVTATAGGNLEGEVNFRLYDTPANCATGGEAGKLFEQTVTVAGPSPQDVSTTNWPGNGPGVTPFSTNVTDATTYYWRVTYTSTNAAQQGRNSYCVEQTTITNVRETGDGTAPTP